MDNAFHKFFSFSLILCVLAVSGLAQAQSAEHARHHAQHQAATHGTVLCSWMCDAGTVLDAAVVLVQPERSPVAIVSLSYSIQVFSNLPKTSPSRAPPHFSS